MGKPFQSTGAWNSNDSGLSKMHCMIVLIFLDSYFPSIVLGVNFIEESILIKLMLLKYQAFYFTPFLRKPSLGFFYVDFTKVLLSFPEDLLFGVLKVIICKGSFRSFIDNLSFVRPSFDFTLRIGWV
jgi:hypothetical protein